MRNESPTPPTRLVARSTPQSRGSARRPAQRAFGGAVGAALASALAVGSVAAGCATGLDVTDAEIAEICADPQIRCGDGPVAAAGAGGAGNAGSSALGGSGNLGGANATPLGGAGGTTSGSNSGGDLNTGGVFVTAGTGPTLNGGAGGSEPLPLAEGECMETDDVVILYTNRGNGSTNDQQASMTLKVLNNAAPFELTALTIRYWFTADGLSGFTGDIDYASQAGGQQLSGVTVTFGQELGSDYAEIGFSNGSSVGPEGVDTIQIRIHTGDYQQLNHANDFSFVAVADSAPNRNLTPYINGVQVGGCVPIE